MPGSGSPQEPTFEALATFPLAVNDATVTDAVTQAFTQAFGADRVHELAPVPASEDFSLVPAALGVAFTYWGNGGFLPGMPVVGNHNTEAAVAAALAYLGKS